MRRDSGNAARFLRGGEVVRFFVGEDVALARQPDGGRHDAGEAELAVGLLGVDQAGDGAGNADGFVAEGG